VANASLNSDKSPSIFISFGARVATPRTPGDNFDDSAAAGATVIAINKTIWLTSGHQFRGMAVLS
jgi:hypothetical protein